MKDKLRVIHVINVRWFNATAWYGLYLAQLMKEAGHEVLVLGLGGTTSFKKAESMGLCPQAFPLNAQDPLKIGALWRSLSTLVSEFKPHIVNCHRGENYPLWALLRKKYRFCLIRTRGDQRPPKKGIINRFLHNTMSDAIITTNSLGEKLLHERLLTPTSKITTILGGVDRHKFSFTEQGRASFRKEHNIPDSAFILGILGRFDYVKGQKELISAFAEANKLLAPHKDTRLLLAGFSSEVSEQEVSSWVASAGINGIITGKCDDVASCLSAMDAGVVASLGSEAIARAALEIMSVGVPLISTNIGVMPDLLPQWAIVPPKDEPMLSALIAKVINDDEWRNQLQDYCVTKISSLSGEAFLERTINVYEKALHESLVKPLI